MFGIGAEIRASIFETDAFDYLDASVQCVTGANVPMPYAEVLELLTYPYTENMVTAARAVLSRSLSI